MDEGEYIRDRHGEIYKITNILKQGKQKIYCLDRTIDTHEDRAENEAVITEENIKDMAEENLIHSENIIDLMTIGDLINTDYGWGWFVRKNNENEVLIDFGDEFLEVEKEQIKEILTEEQRDKYSYKIQK